MRFSRKSYEGSPIYYLTLLGRGEGGIVKRYNNGKKLQEKSKKALHTLPTSSPIISPHPLQGKKVRRADEHPTENKVFFPGLRNH